MDLSSPVKELLHYKTGTQLQITWTDGLAGLYELDTFYDTDNGLEMEESGYREFHAALVKVCDGDGGLLEIGGSENITESVTLVETGDVIWRRCDNE